MGLAPILLIKLNNDAKRTSKTLFQKKNDHQIHVNLIHSIIPSRRTSRIMWSIIKSKAINDLRREVEKVMKKLDLNYVPEVIGAFVRRVYSVENMVVN